MAMGFVVGSLGARCGLHWGGHRVPLRGSLGRSSGGSLGVWFASFCLVVYVRFFILLLSDLLPSPMSSQILRPANCLPNCFLNGLQARSETPFRSLGYEVSTSKPLGSSANLSKSIGGKFSSEATLHRSSLDKASRGPCTFRTQDGRLRPTQYWETRPAGSRLPRNRAAGREDLK